MSPSNDFSSVRAAIVDLGRWLYERGWIAAADGNISVRVDDDVFVVTPTSRNKGRLGPDELVVVAADGTLIQGTASPSAEFALHLAVYRAYPTARAVVHAHPPKCVALTLAHLSLDRPVLPELLLHLGRVPTVPYELPTSQALADAVAERLAPDVQALLLERHGSVTWGEHLDEARDRLERLEHAADILVHAAAVAGPVLQTLEPPQVDELLRLGGHQGTEPRSSH